MNAVHKFNTKYYYVLKLLFKKEWYPIQGRKKVKIYHPIR